VCCGRQGQSQGLTCFALHSATLFNHTTSRSLPSSIVDVSLFSSPTLVYISFSFIHLITDLLTIPWSLVLVTRSPTLEISLPTPQCRSHTPNSISRSGVTMMQNQTLVTHMAREMGVQHILPPIPTTTTPASMTPPVSITPYSHLIYVGFQFQYECIVLPPGTMIFLSFALPTAFRGGCLVFSSLIILRVASRARSY
jgi:hypothetical protein